MLIAPLIADAIGCLHIRYIGPQRRMHLRTERWVAGKMVDHAGSIKRIERMDEKIAIALNAVSICSEEMYNITISTPGEVHRLRMKGPENDNGKTSEVRILELQDDLVIPIEESTAIWGYGLFTEGTFSGNASIEANAKAAQWALIVSVTFFEAQDEPQINLVPIIED